MKVRAIADDDIVVGSCDWGDADKRRRSRCDEPTFAQRFDDESGRWLEVCSQHAGRKPLAAEKS